MSVVLRAPEFDDVPAIVALLDGVAELTGLPETTEADVGMWFTSPTFDVGNNFRVAVGEDGDFAAMRT